MIDTANQASSNSTPEQDRAARQRLASDPQRPRYHFLPPSNWMNDPNGLIQWRGRYHMFYQYNPQAAVWGNISWGHAVSDDLVHWDDLPVALEPTPSGPDADGCFSGCAVDNQGVPTIVYTGVRGDQQLTCIATSDDDDLVTWHKHAANPVISETPAGLSLVAYRDHSVWREDGQWHQVVGAGIRGTGGAALLYRSPDLLRWEYLHPLAEGDASRTEPVWTGPMWECPALVDLGPKHALLVSVWDEATLYSACMLGTYANQRLTIEATTKFDYGDNYFYAAQAMIDQQGRRLLWGWVQEGRTSEAQVAAGWSGVMSLPRVLALRPDGLLSVEPAPELAALRGRHQRFASSTIAPGARGLLDALKGDSLELVAELAPGSASTCGLILRRSPDGAEQTAIVYDQAAGTLAVDRSRASLSDDVERDPRSGPLRLAAGEPLRLHIFLDRSVLEIFANGHVCLTTRIYPSRADSLELDLFATGGEATLRSLELWELASIWPKQAGRPA